MAISVNPQTFVITIPQADLTLVSGTIYELDTNAFRLELKAWEDDQDGGITFLKTHTHNTTVTVAGTTFARTVEVLPPYSVEFEDGQYSVILKGSNNNVFDVAGGILVQNQVQIISTNSAGLVEISTSSGITPGEISDIADAVWDEPLSAHGILGSSGLSQRQQDYNGSVAIDVAGSAGTVHPVGTDNSPVNNIADALTIAAANNLTELHFHSNYTIISGTNISGYVISSPNHATITLNSGVIAQYTNYKLINLTGVLGGLSIIENCSVDGISNFYGYMDKGTFNGDITLSVNSAHNAVFENCFTGDVTGPPTIDCSGDGAKVSLRGLTGAVLFTNKTGGTNFSFIDLYSARVGFDSTVTAGTWTVRGVGYIYQDDSSGTTFDLQGLMSKSTISVAVWDEILNKTTHNLPNSAGRRLRALSSLTLLEDDVVSATTNTVTLQGASAVDGAYDPAIITITDGTGVGQSRLILEYDGASMTAVVDRDWKVIPDNSSVFLISSNPGREHVNEGLAQGGTVNTITLNALASPNNDNYVGQVVAIRSGTGEDQACRVIAYDGTTKVATMAQNWNVTPDTTSAYVMLPTSVLDIEGLVESITDSVWDETAEDHEIEDTMGDRIRRILYGSR